MGNFTIRISSIIACLLLSSIAMAQGSGLVIQRFLAKPAGTESPYEFVELVATRNIDFSTERYTVVFCDAKDASTAGWPQGGVFTYGFEIPATAGTVTAGTLIYVGGSSLTVNGTSCFYGRQINYATNTGDGFGNASTTGVLGNGGSHADGLAVFNVAAASISGTSVPVDAVFFGTAVGNAAGKFKVPANDMYAGGTFGTGTGNGTLAPDPSGTSPYVYVTGGTFNTVTGNWDVARSWAKNGVVPSCADALAITLSSSTPPPVNTLGLVFDSVSTTTYLSAPNVSGVLNDPSDPAKVNGVVLKVKDNNVDIAASQYTLTAASSNTSVVTNANIVITKNDGFASIKITPSAVGYATITLTLARSGNQQNYILNYAASAAATHPANAVYHTGYSDASTAIALDDNYMIVSDDEKNILNVYNRHQSGLPVKSFDYGTLTGGGLNLTDLSGGVPREIDLEASARSLVNPSRMYWLGSHSNKSNPSFDLRPNRNRIFATDVTGTGATTSFSFAGYYDGLRTAMTAWSNTNNLGLVTSMANGFDPKLIDGFNMEGMAFGPDNTTMYIGFRAPLEPTTNRVNALIAPIQNFETWFGNGTTATPVLGSPILLDLGGKGIREIVRLSQNSYVIAAGDYGDNSLITSAIYRWNGNPSDAPVALPEFNVTAFNPEGLLPVYVSGVMSDNQLEIINDNGTVDYYNDGTAAKDLTVNSFKKFSSNLLQTIGTPLPILFQYFNASYIGNGKALLKWNADNNQGFSKFEIERSADGISFERIGGVAINNNEHAFTFTDNVCCVESYLYRIRAVGINDGSFYSAIQLVRLPGNAQPAIVSHVIHSNELEISTPGNASAKTMHLYNLNGQRLMSRDFKETAIVVSLSGLSEGMYIVEVVQDGNTTRKKIVK